MKAVIVGTGYVGLTTGVALAYLGHEVSCLDVIEDKIKMLKAGKSPIYEHGLEELMELAKPNLQYTSSYEEAGIEEADVVFISVGTPQNPDGTPNLEYVKQAAISIGQHLGTKFTVIVNKSTVPIGSGNWVSSLVRDAMTQVDGLKPEDRFAMASNPEFLREGTALHDTLYPDRIVVGAEEEQALTVLTSLYRPILNQDFPALEFLPRPEGFGAVPIVTADLASAELIKYAANAFLSVKISYINEVAQLAEKVGADIMQIARGIGLDTRIGSRFLSAGIGWGGSCFGKDTAALITTAEEYRLPMSIVKSARDVNYQQRVWVVEKLLNELKILKGRTIAILGLAFKAQTDDLRDAPALDIAKHLMQRGAKVKAHDPVALAHARKYFGDSGIHFMDSVEEVLQEADAVVLVTEWPEYRKLDWENLKVHMKTPLLLDGRNFLTPSVVEQSGLKYIGVGRGHAKKG
ncbi:MAG: UDP-glucose/GDP-mannose dehydrogenase family protein [Anaerolineales bacterium]|nr:UDP-glucose/GDP-mannose dehydrogenase family protein [Anaerolineales bacterium]